MIKRKSLRNQRSSSREISNQVLHLHRPVMPTMRKVRSKLRVVTHITKEVMQTEEEEATLTQGTNDSIVEGEAPSLSTLQACL